MSLSPRTIGICGVGLIGGSIGLGLKTSGFPGRIIGLSSPETLGQAQAAGCIDEGYGYDKLPLVAAQCDLLFLCAPIYSIIATIEQLGNCELPNGLIITDVGSTKRAIMESARAHLPDHVDFVGGHPMAGSEKSGASAADPYLFQNAIYAFIASAPEKADRAQALALFCERYLGCRHVVLSDELHDRIAAAVSHLPHLLAVALVNTVEREEQLRPGTLSLAAGGFRDLTRVASSPYSMWHDILFTNKEKIASLLDTFSEVLSDLRAGISHRGSLEAEFDSAKRTRDSVPLAGKGFIKPLTEILVIAQDKPGMIASIASTLAQEQINIKDIEVMKIREGTGGTIRIAVESFDLAQKAVELLRAQGITARERQE